MAEKLQHYTELATEMLKRDEPRDEMFLAMDAMWMSQWELPMKPTGYVHKVVSTDPHDAIRSGTRVLSSGDPRITLQPLGSLPEDREVANNIERALKWHFLNASRRRRATTVADFVQSALLYDEIIAQVVYIPEQIKQAKALKQDTKRLKASLRFGPFAIILRNPRNVHVTYSDYMPEEVLMQKVMTVEEVVQFWGEKNAKKLIKDSKNLKNNKGNPYVTLYDYTDHERRVVFAYLQERRDKVTKPDADEKAAIVFNEKHDLPFLPWVCHVGGTNLFDSGIAQRQPLLWSIFMSKQWNTQNIIETLVASEAIAYSGAPRLAVEGPTSQIDVDYGEVGRKAWIPPGHSLTSLQPPQIDSGLLAIGDRVGGRIAKSTIPRVLQTGDIPSGTPFSALNLITQSGLKSLVPYKKLAELALSGVFRRMLEWIDHSGDDLFNFVDATAPDGSRVTEMVGIEKDDIDVENIHLTVELAEDAPTDRVARANVGRMMIADMGYPKAKVMEQQGETDPAALVEQARQEHMADMEESVELQTFQTVEMGKVKRSEAALDFQLQMEMQQAAQQQQAQAQQQQQGQNGTMSGRLRNQEVQRQAAANRGGPGFDTAQGGTPQVQATNQQGGGPQTEES